MSYYEIPAISASSLKLYANNPTLFFKVIKGETKTKDTEALSFGRIVHSKVFTPELFKDEYIISSESCPPAISAVLDNLLTNALALEVYDLKSLRTQILDCCKVCSYQSSWKENTKIESILKYEKYWDFMIASRDKKIITMEDYLNANIYEECLRNHPGAAALIFGEDEEVLLEHEIFWEYKGLPMKSKLDKVKINHTNKVIKLIDLKTTSESVYGRVLYNDVSPYTSIYTGFLRECVKYDYILQLGGVYYEAVKSLFPDYRIEVYVVPVNSFQSTAYKFPDKWVYAGLGRFNSYISEIIQVSKVREDRSIMDLYHPIIDLEDYI